MKGGCRADPPQAGLQAPGQDRKEDREPGQRLAAGRLAAPPLRRSFFGAALEGQQLVGKPGAAGPGGHGPALLQQDELGAGQGGGQEKGIRARGCSAVPGVEDQGGRPQPRKARVGGPRVQRPFPALEPRGGETGRKQPGQAEHVRVLRLQTPVPHGHTPHRLRCGLRGQLLPAGQFPAQLGRRRTPQQRLQQDQGGDVPRPGGGEVKRQAAGIQVPQHVDPGGFQLHLQQIEGREQRFQDVLSDAGVQRRPRELHVGDREIIQERVQQVVQDLVREGGVGLQRNEGESPGAGTGDLHPQPADLPAGTAFRPGHQGFIGLR